MAMSPVKHINVIKGKFYYSFTCKLSIENYAFFCCQLDKALRWRAYTRGR